MMPLPGSAHEYQLWDAAYVLGSLSSADRREFEAHLAECPSCRAAVTELSGMPALLAQLDHDVLASFDQPDSTAATQAAPPVLPSLLAAARWRRRRTRLAWVAGAAAAVLVALGVLVGGIDQDGHVRSPVPPPPTSAAALPMTQVHTALLASTVSLSDQSWGTLIELQCVCLAPSGAPQDTLAMVVVGRDGSRTRLASWVAHPGHTATPTGSTSMPAQQIAAVQVVSADSGQVLLQRTL